MEMYSPFPGMSSIYSDGGSRLENKSLEQSRTGTVCIQLKKPRSVPIHILKTDKAESVFVITVRGGYYGNLNSSVVVGTVGKRKTSICDFNKLRSRPKPYSSIAYRDKLAVMNKSEKKEVYAKSKYRYSIVDLSEIFRSKCTVTDDDESIEVRCVVQQKKTCFRFREGQSDQQFNGLNYHMAETNQMIWRLIEDRLPLELYYEIMKNLNYDQVNWLADKDERFARALAKTRYNIESYDKKTFPDLSSLLKVIRKEATKEIRFGRGEDMWLVSFGDDKNPGVARRFAVQPGVYKWTTAFSFTSMRIDSERSCCQVCTYILNNLVKAMARNQEDTLIGNSRIKIFSLVGAEGVRIDPRFTSPYYKGAQVVSGDYDYVVQMWHEHLDNRWLQDIEIRDGRFTYEQYISLAHFKTLIFKDPVKFFGTSKILDMVGEGVLSLTSKLDGEVVGYLVEDEEFRFRFPLCSETSPSYAVGLNFLPSTLIKEMYAAKAFVQHIRQHEVNCEILVTKERLRDLLLLRPLGEAEAAHVQRSINDALHNIDRLKSILFRDCSLVKRSTFEESPDKNTLHIHEVYEENIDLCTRYIFNELNLSDTTIGVINRNAEMLFSRCTYEKRNRNNFCTLKVINPIALRSAYTVKTGLTLKTDYV